MSKSHQQLTLVINQLIKCGFVLDGSTREEVVRVPTSKSPLLGKSGGELTKFGGRQRFAKTGTKFKATVGLRTTFIYMIDASANGIKSIASHNTADYELIKKTLESL